MGECSGFMAGMAADVMEGGISLRRHVLPASRTTFAAGRQKNGGIVIPSRNNSLIKGQEVVRETVRVSIYFIYEGSGLVFLLYRLCNSPSFALPFRNVEDEVASCGLYERMWFQH
jgi:hypothetical protein